MTTTPLLLISCVADKAAEACEARDLYRSDWFRKARAYAEAHEADWLILSAAHGLLDPRQMIEPYDVTLHDMDKAERQAWAEGVMRQLRQRGQQGRPVAILAGERYREFLEPMVARFVPSPELCAVPMRGLGIGQQKAWLAARAGEARAARDALGEDSALSQLEADREVLVAWFDTVGRAELTPADCRRYLGRAAMPSARDALRIGFELDRRLALLRLAIQRDDLDAAIRDRRQAIPLERADRERRRAQTRRVLRRLGVNFRHLAVLAFTPSQELTA